MSDHPAPSPFQPLAGLALPGSGNFSRDVRFAPAPEAPAEPEAEAEPEVDPLELAHATGFAEGLAAGRAEAEQARISADAARASFAFAFERIDAELAEALRLRLRDTVIALCEASLAPLALDPEALARRVAAATELFRRADDQRVIRLNPEDHVLVASLLPAGWAFHDDPALPRGTLRVETSSGGAEDGPLQWRRALDEALERC